jgi:hypothetical protein
LSPDPAIDVDDDESDDDRDDGDGEEHRGLSHWKNGAPSTAQARIPMDPDDHRSIYPNIYKCVPADLLILGEGFGGERRWVRTRTRR